MAARRTIVRVTSRPAAEQHLRDLARLRRVRDRIDREYAQPLDVEALARDALGFELRGHVGRGKMRWITVGPAGQPGTSILLAPPATDPGVTDDERRTIAEMMAKGTYGWILLATKDLDGTFERLQASDAEVVQEPVEQPYGIRDCAFRDPAGNLVRIQEVR